MLDVRSYSRHELIELFGTDRLDSIKAKLKRQGYKYTTTGRGDTFTLTIESCPPEFRNFCINELGFAPQTDFNRLKYFLYRFFRDPEFQQMPVSEMERVLNRENMYVSQATIANWIRKLIEADLVWRSFADFNYFAVNDLRRDKQFWFIDRETYVEAWKAYFAERDLGYTYSGGRLYEVAKGTPHKIGKIIENAFALDKLNKLMDILEKEKDLNE